jgi:hypothetical protein
MTGEIRTRSEFTDYARGLLTIYQVERADQQTSGNQSRALLGTGLAYAAAAAALLSRVSQGVEGVDRILVIAAPLPLIALISLLILGIGNIQQRALYLVALEAELEPFMTRLVKDPDTRLAPVVPNGFRRSEYVFAPPWNKSVPPTADGASRKLRGIASLLMGLLTHGAMLAVELGLIAYAASLLPFTSGLAMVVIYGLFVAAQVVGWMVALRPSSW